MKTRIWLLGIFALTTLAIAAPHTWTLHNGKTFEGDYFLSGTSAVVVRINGTNSIFKIADLSTNDLAYDQGQDDRPNPLVNLISNLKHGDKVRLYGSVDNRGVLSDDYTSLFFYIDRFETIETAAEKKASEQVAENP